MIPFFREVLENATNFPHIQVILVSLIPSVLPEVHKRFSEANALLKSLVQEKDQQTNKRRYENASFLNLSPTLSPSDKASPVYFNSLKVDPRTQRQKDVHLNGLGAYRLAYSIFDHCSRFIINKFTYIRYTAKSF